ncbi:hypothetical protein Tco_0475020 [Tanacetum coccineum]
MDCLSGAVVAVSDELVSSITQVVNLFLAGKCPMMLGEYIASAPLTPLVKPGGGIRPIAVGTVWRRLVSKVSATMIGHSLDGYLDGLQFGVGVPGGGEAILHAVNRLVEDRGDDVVLSMLLVDFQNAFNLVDRTVMLEEVRLRCPAISRWVEFCYYIPARLYRDGEHSLWSCQGVQQEDGPRCGLHLNVDKTELFWPKEDPRSSCWLIRACGGGFLNYTFAMRTCPPRIFESAQLSFDMALRSALERIVRFSGPGFGSWQWRLATLPFAFGGLGVYSAGDVLNYAFIASRLQSAALQTKLLRYVGIVATGPTFDDALCVFNSAMEIDFLSNPSESHAPNPEENGRHIFHSDWLRVVPISGLGQTMNGFAGKEVDIGLGGDGDKALRPADMLLYSWEGGLDVCVDLTGSSPLTQTGMTDFVPGRVVIDARTAQTG